MIPHQDNETTKDLSKNLPALLKPVRVVVECSWNDCDLRSQTFGEILKEINSSSSFL